MKTSLMALGPSRRLRINMPSVIELSLSFVTLLKAPDVSCSGPTGACPIKSNEIIEELGMDAKPVAPC